MRIVVRFLLSLSLLVWVPGAVAESNQSIMDSIVVHPDFDLELMVREPLVFDPVDLEFDALGRAFVIEMPGYPFPEEEGRVVLLEDSTGDGRWDKRTVYAENFPVASSIMCYRDGILVASPPDLIYLKDTDGDNVADVREVVMAGLASDNTQHNFNGLTYGLDNWVYVANGGNTRSAFWPDSDERLFIGWNDFRVELEGQRFETIGRTSGGFELALDDWGRVYETHNLEHVSQLVFPGRYLKNLVLDGRDTLYNISDHEEHGTSRIFALGEQETRVNHPEQSGYFSGACGITHYGGGAFPAAFQGNLFVPDCVLNLVHRDTLSWEGPAGTAKRGREGVEFLASTDRSFRPVNLTVGPDGALYVLDMHRDVIEHPEWIPDEMEVHMDLDAGKDEGRIFRVVPKSGRMHETTPYTRDNLEGVVEALAHVNQWNRLTAQRLLVEWQDESSIPLVRKQLTNAQALGRLHALYTLHGLNALQAEEVINAMEDVHAGVREHAVQLAEHFLDTKAVRKAVYACVDDNNPRVRLFTALAIGSINRAGYAKEVQKPLATLLEKDVHERWGNLALCSVLGGDAEVATATAKQLIPELLKQGSALETNYGRAFVEVAYAQSTATQDPKLFLKQLEGLAASETSASIRESALTGLLEGMNTYDRPEDTSSYFRNAVSKSLAPFESADALPLTLAAWRLGRHLEAPASSEQEGLLATANTKSLDSSLSLENRLAQLTLLQFAPLTKRVDTLFALLDIKEPRELQQAAARQISSAGGKPEGARLLTQWNALGPASRSTAVDFLLRRSANHDQLLTALETGKIAIGQMRFDLERRRHLLWSDNKNVAERAAKLFNDAGVVTRAEALEKMRPALSMDGDLTRGRQLYQENCAQCHRLGEDGFDVGPSLTDIGRKSKETLLHDILDPNAAVNSEYINYTLEIATEDVLAEETIFSGIIVGETADEVRIRLAGGAEHSFKRSQLKSMQSSGLSMMPEELESGMDVQQFADLMAYLQQAR